MAMTCVQEAASPSTLSTWSGWRSCALRAGWRSPGPATRCPAPPSTRRTSRTTPRPSPAPPTLAASVSRSSALTLIYFDNSLINWSHGSLFRLRLQLCSEPVRCELQQIRDQQHLTQPEHRQLSSIKLIQIIWNLIYFHPVFPGRKSKRSTVVYDQRRRNTEAISED